MCQAVRIPEEYINEGPVNSNPVENVAYNSDVYGLYGKVFQKNYIKFKIHLFN